jgi:palmitoyl-protein thioesterase
MKFFATAFISAVSAAGLPTAMFHGFGDACINPGDGQFDKIIKKGTGAPVHCIEVGLPFEGEVLGDIQNVADISCQKVANNTVFHGDFNVVGLSQGGLLARYIVESCEMPGRVRNMVTIGGPHMGVDKIPNCLEGTICNLVNDVARNLVYDKTIQEGLVPAGYFRNPNDIEAYKKGSVFLPSLNNEIEQESDAAKARKERFSALNGAMLVMFSNDTMISPKETAHFETHNEGYKRVVPVNETDFYKNDYIGLKSLDDAGKIKRVEWPGEHLQFSNDQITNEVVPFLM